MRDDLTERRRQILKLVIQEYIESPARPVASETLLRKYGLQYSSASLRRWKSKGC
jgi:heat-inducible transcriptional repressor